jgi:hypothetical protein
MGKPRFAAVRQSNMGVLRTWWLWSALAITAPPVFAITDDPHREATGETYTAQTAADRLAYAVLQQR